MSPTPEKPITYERLSQQFVQPDKLDAYVRQMVEDGQSQLTRNELAVVLAYQRKLNTGDRFQQLRREAGAVGVIRSGDRNEIIEGMDWSRHTPAEHNEHMFYLCSHLVTNDQPELAWDDDDLTSDLKKRFPGVELVSIVEVGPDEGLFNYANNPSHSETQRVWVKVDDTTMGLVNQLLEK